MAEARGDHCQAECTDSLGIVGTASYPTPHCTRGGLEEGHSAESAWVHVTDRMDSDGDRSTTRIGFDNIAEAEAVYHLLRSIHTGSA